MSIHIPTPFNPARIWADDDFAQLRRLAKARLSSGQIASQLGRTKWAIEGMCARRRISLPGGTGAAPGAREAEQKRFAALRARVAARQGEQPVPVLWVGGML